MPTRAVPQLESLPLGQLQHAPRPRRVRDVLRRFTPPPAEDVFHLLTHGAQVDAQRAERLGGQPAAVVDEPEQEVLRASMVVAESPGLFLGQGQRSKPPLGKPVEHVPPPFDPREPGQACLVSRYIALADKARSIASDLGRRRHICFHPQETADVVLAYQQGRADHGH